MRVDIFLIFFTKTYVVGTHYKRQEALVLYQGRIKKMCV